VKEAVVYPLGDAQAILAARPAAKVSPISVESCSSCCGFMRARSGVSGHCAETQRHVFGQETAKGWSCSAVGGGVSRLTETRQNRLAISAGKMASRSVSRDGRCAWTKAVSQKTVTKVPVKMDATAAEAVARFQ